MRPLLLPALTLTALLGSAQAAPGAPDLEAAATRVAQALDGVVRNCPAAYAKIGTAAKRCVGAPSTTEQTRMKLTAALKDDLHGVWRSRDEQRSVYNWLRTPGGFVYLRLQPDPDGRAETLVYLDVPPEAVPAAAGSAAPTPPAVTVTSETGTVTISRPAEPPKAPAAPAVKPAAPSPTTPVPKSAAEPRPATPPASAAAPRPAVMAPVPFRRVLGVQSPRMNGSDVLAVQNRLIALTLGGAGGRGDGWYGPVTAATVRAFQAVNGLPVTGRVDEATWRRLFSDSARPFQIKAVSGS
ncbi:peptidoglycan-binding domain-containing protein [Deinococcus ficus]|uniref:Peptidoglycan-binding protein n=1 Tax=Deinococcus ficus TaxID=317577 RepID=A0A221ST42_9DEIO|nr:peptidoglycan-binding domain-containing protein [Deinococcus ficus]ASN79822.1 peptidoglycan-binding protein [Deinococcus ficus]